VPGHEVLETRLLGNRGRRRGGVSLRVNQTPFHPAQNAAPHLQVFRMFFCAAEQVSRRKTHWLGGEVIFRLGHDVFMVGAPQALFDIPLQHERQGPLPGPFPGSIRFPAPQVLEKLHEKDRRAAKILPYRPVLGHHPEWPAPILSLLAGERSGNRPRSVQILPITGRLVNRQVAAAQKSRLVWFDTVPIPRPAGLAIGERRVRQVRVNRICGR